MEKTVSKKGGMMTFDMAEIKIIDGKTGKVRARHVIGKGRWYKLKMWFLRRHNSITQYGMAAEAAMILAVNSAASATPPFIYMNMGVGTTPASVTQYELQTPILTARVTAQTSTSSSGNTAYGADMAVWAVTFCSSNYAALTGTVTATEFGIFNASATLAAANGVSNAMLFRQTWGGDQLNWGQGDSVVITAKCQMEQGS
jgi:hypothetical protein